MNGPIGRVRRRARAGRSTGAAMRRRVVIHWGISSFFGWGVYGLNLALHWARDPDLEPIASFPIRDSEIAIDSLKRLALKSFFADSAELVDRLKPFTSRPVGVDGPVLAALGNEFSLPTLRPGSPSPDGRPSGWCSSRCRSSTRQRWSGRAPSH